MQRYLDMERELSDLAARAEAFLFTEGGTLTLHRLTKFLKTDEKSTREALAELSASLGGSGLTLIQTERDVSLATAPRVEGAVREWFEESLARDIGDAGLEVLAVILYRGDSTRAEIDYIRGVNTTSTSRTLLTRGLLERVSNVEDARQYVYHPTAELLAHLGVRTCSELPDYDTIRAELAAFESTRSAFENHDGDTDAVGNA